MTGEWFDAAIQQANEVERAEAAIQQANEVDRLEIQTGHNALTGAIYHECRNLEGRPTCGDGEGAAFKCIECLRWVGWCVGGCETEGEPGSGEMCSACYVKTFIVGRASE